MNDGTMQKYDAILRLIIDGLKRNAIPAPRYKVASLTNLSTSCPSQWKGQLDDGRDLYIRYRYGTLTASVESEIVASIEYGDPLSGVLSTDEMESLLENWFDFSAV